MEQIVQLFGRIECVSYPCYVAQVVFLSFFYFHKHVDGFLIVLADAIAYNHGIAVTQLVVFVDDKLLVGLIVLFHKLLGAEQVEQLALFVGLLHHAFQLLGGEGLVADNRYLVYFDFLFLVDIDVYNNLVFLCRIVHLVDDDFSILEAFVVKISLNQCLGTVNGVHVYLAAFDHTDFGFKVFTLGLFNAVVAYVGYTRTHGEMDGHPYFVTFNLVGCNTYI